MAKIEINDVFVEIREENNRLISDLEFCQKRIDLLETFRECLKKFDENCVCVENCFNKKVFNLLEEKYEKEMTNGRIDRQLNLNKQLVNCKQTVGLSDKTQNEWNEEIEENNVLDPNLDQKYWIKSENQTNTELITISDTNSDFDSNIEDLSDESNTNCETNEEYSTSDSKLVSNQLQLESNCSDSQYETKSIYSLEYEERSHSLAEPLICNEIGCGKSFGDRYQLSRHKNGVHSTDQFVCNWPECGKKFKRGHTFKDHQLIHRNERRFQCSVDGCLHRTNTLNALIHHKRRIHEQQEHRQTEENPIRISIPALPSNAPMLTNRRVKCDESGCDLICKSENALKRHKLNVHNIDKPYRCEWPGCEARIKNLHAFRDHILIHKNELRYKCEYKDCQTRTNTRNAMFIHLKRKHYESNMLYPCTWPGCHTNLSTSAGIASHLFRHQNIRPFKCTFDECDQSFYNNFLLNEHLMKVHNKTDLEKRLFRCDEKECDNSYSLMSNLLQVTCIDTNN